MRNPADFFEKNKYVHLNKVLSKEYCDGLTDHMFKLYEEGRLVKDDQCPLSDAIYGDPVFDSLLDKLAVPIGEHIGLELLPTYTYCRIYRKGEVLEKHIDRPSCQISGTITLGVDEDSAIWPIYFSTNPKDKHGKRMDLEIGDMVMYRGEELAHWRPAFKGNWQVQLFVHYVDKNDKYRDYVYDGRPSLGLPATAKQSASNDEYDEYAIVEDEQPTLTAIEKEPSPPPTPTIEDEYNTSEGVDENTAESSENEYPSGSDDDADEYPAGEVESTEKERDVHDVIEKDIRQAGGYDTPDLSGSYGRFPVFGGVMIPSWDLDLPKPVSFSSKFGQDLTFSKQECEAIISIADNRYPDFAGVGMGEQARVDTRIRNVTLYEIPIQDDTHWLFEKIARAASVANMQYFNFDLMGISHGLQLLKYDMEGDDPGHYEWHIDMGSGDSATRKLSLSVQLSPPEDYTGAELLINSYGELAQSNKEQGSVTFFPSYLLHKVTPIQSGVRWALVIWVHGTRRFR